METKVTPNKFFSIEQAGNWLKEFKNNLVKTVKKTVSDNAKISIAPPKDRRKFLTYGISLLQDVDQENMDLFYTITGKSRHLYSGSEIATMFRQLLTLRVNYYSIEQIAHVFHTPPDILKKVEMIAIVSCNRAIDKAKVDAIPLVGGLN